MTERRTPNTQECIYFGRKLSSLCSNIETSQGQVQIGSDNDDEIYFDTETMEPYPDMVKERVQLYVLSDTENNTKCLIKIDLEDILNFAAKFCLGMYTRTLEQASND